MIPRSKGPSTDIMRTLGFYIGGIIKMVLANYLEARGT